MLMKEKNILRLVLLIALSVFLQSCRTNDEYISSKDEEYYSNKFQVFGRPAANGKVDYPNGFAFLFKEYDRIHNSDFTGLKLSENNFTLQKSSVALKYVDFSISSQPIKLDDGQIWVYFPIVENRNVTGIIVGALRNAETFVTFGTLTQNEEYNQMVLERFRSAYINKTAYASRGGVDEDTGPCGGSAGDPCDIGEINIPPPRGPYLPSFEVGIYPGQGGGGGNTPPPTGGCSMFQNCGGNPPEPKDPCQKASESNTKAKELINKAKVAAAKGEITGTLSTDTNEKSFSYGKDSNGNYDTTPIKTSTAGNQVGVQANNPNLSIEGGVHTHTVDLYNCFSAGDIYSLQGANAINSNFTTFFVFANGGIGYALTIIDPVKYANFVANYSAGSNLDMSTSHWQTTSPIYVSFESATTQFINQGYSQDDALANGMAFVLSKYDVGATLSQADSSGNFSSIFVEENKNNINVNGVPLSISTYKQTPDCNLK